MAKTMMAAVCAAAILAGLSAAVYAAPAAPQTNIFNTKDWRKDTALWTTPEYYRFNTSGQLGGMALNIVPYEDTGQVAGARLYGSMGSGKPGTTNLASPYPFKTAMEQYNAWLKAAKGGTKHTRATIPDWNGEWGGGGGGGGGRGPASDVVKFLKPQYQAYYVQALKASTEGRGWSPSGMCLPGGFFSTLGAREFWVRPGEVLTTSESANSQEFIRWIFTDTTHTPANLQFPKWNGESVGFWDGDALIVHTNQIRGWKGGPGGEYTDDMETVEKYRRVGDMIQGEITIYDPAVFTGPVYEKMNYRLTKNVKPQDRPQFNTCSDTQGPSPAVHLDQNGFLNERIPGDPGFDWNPAEPRPWGVWLDRSDQRYRAYLAKGGKPPVSADVTPTGRAARPDVKWRTR